MRLVFLVLIAAGLNAQDTAKEAKFAAGGGELRYLYIPAAGGEAPLLMVLPGSMEEDSVRKLFTQWQPLAVSRGWNFVMPFIAGVSDQAAKALELTLTDAKKRLLGIDETRVYLAGPGASAADVFYALSREPHLWSAALAIQGTPAAAINSYRLFGANTQQAPLLWIAPAAEVDLYRGKLTAAEYNFEGRPEARTDEVFDWLAKHQRARFPATVDCETGNPNFARCY